MSIINGSKDEKKEMQLDVLEILQINERKHKKTTMVFAGIMLIICIISFCVIGVMADKMAEQKEQIEMLRDAPIVVTPVNPEIVLDIIKEEMNGIGELATMEYLYTDVAIFTDSKQIKNWNIPLTEKSFKIQWDGAIKAGINFEEIDIDVDAGDSEIIVRVPATEILSYEVFHDTVVVLEEKDNIFNKIKLEDRVEFDAANEKAMIEKAIGNGILEKAQENANIMIEELIRSIPEADSFDIEFEIDD